MSNRKKGACGIPREEIVPIIQRINFCGEFPNRDKHLQEMPIYQRACDEYGSWSAALEAAGISKMNRKNLFWEPRERRKWSKLFIIKAIHDRRRTSKPLLAMRVYEADRSLYKAACYYFGSWRAAVGAAGYDYREISRIERPTKTRKAECQVLE